MEPGRHAVVMGASMGGLLAARVLAERYERVTLIDRDALRDADEPRKGVPQGRHAHGLLAGGRVALEQLFPGLTSELTARGALLGDLAGDCLWYAQGGYLDGTGCGLAGLLVSRPLLERAVRDRVSRLPQVRIVDRCPVRGLAFVEGRQRVSGVELARGETLAADLVVDACGRGSQARNWLAAAGFEPPPVEGIEVGIRYTTRAYRRRPHEAQGKRAVLVAAGPPSWRSAAALAQEGDRWILTLAGYLGDEAPAEECGFLEFARSLGVTEITEIAGRAFPISPFYRFAYPASVRHRWEVTRVPAGYLAFGDAICSFNPVYGQGMTVAALEALALRDCLAREEKLAERFFKSASRLVDIPWSIAAGADLRNPAVVGRRTAAGRLLNGYIARLQAAAQQDGSLTRAFLEVTNLMAQPWRILTPAVAWRVLVHSRRYHPSAPARSHALSA